MVNSNDPDSQRQLSAFVPGFDFDIFVSYSIPAQQKKKLADLEEWINMSADDLSDYEEQLQRLEQSPGSEEKKQNLQKKISRCKKRKEMASQKIYILQNTNDWLDNLIKHLKVGLAQELNTEVEKIKIWPKTPGDKATSLPDDTQRVVRSSAVLLVIFSDHYLKSQSCQKERKPFLEIPKQKGGDNRRRIVMVQQTETDRELWPEEFDDIRVFSLFKKSQRRCASSHFGHA